MILETTASKPQAEFINHTAPFPAFVGGFGSGKTHALILRTLAKIFGDGRDLAYYMPTYGLVRDICYPRFEEILSGIGVPFRINRGEHALYVNGKRIIFRTLDNPDRIIGYEVSDSAVDELDTLPMDKAKRAWEQIIARNRQKKETGINSVSVGTTPEGFRFVYEKWKKNPSPSYALVKAPTSSNQKHLPANYIATLQETYSANLLQAYLEGEFVNLNSGTVYASYDRDSNNSFEEVQDGEPLLIGCDFNVMQQAATVFVQREDGLHAVDELVDMTDTRDMIGVIQSRYHGHMIYMYPDAAGRARNTTNASVSDIALMEQAGLAVRVRKTNPMVRDRVQAMNSALEQGRVWINASKCKRVAECLEQQSYRNGEPDKTTGFDHQNDATTYVIAYEMPIVRPVSNVRFSFAV
jgi:PBSX family phage terminase large subunit